MYPTLNFPRPHLKPCPSLPSPPPPPPPSHQQPPTTPAPPVTPGVSSITTAPLSSLFPTREKDESKPKKYLPTGLTHFNNYSVVDCRSLVKTVVCGVKTITWGVSACKVSTGQSEIVLSELFYHFLGVFHKDSKSNLTLKLDLNIMESHL